MWPMGPRLVHSQEGSPPAVGADGLLASISWGGCVGLDAAAATHPATSGSFNETEGHERGVTAASRGLVLELSGT